MDTLTHALSGALAARATAPKETAPGQLPLRTRVWIGFWAAAFPDSDFIVRFIDPLVYLTTHRGVTHSVVMLPLWAAVLAFVFMWILRRRYSWRAFFGVCAIGIGIHILGDVITAFGTMVLAPFSEWRLQIPTTFIIDPYFTSILIGGLVASMIWKDTRRPAVIGLAVLAALIGLQGIMHQRAVALGERYVEAKGLDGTAVHAIPQPFSPFNWMIVVSDARGYRLSYVNLIGREPRAPAGEDAFWLLQVASAYQPPDALLWVEIPRFGNGPPDAALAEKVWNGKFFARYRRFALFPAVYRVDRDQDRTCVWFNDLRFALFGRNMPFRYGACRASGSDAWRVFRLLRDGGNEILDAIRVEG